MPYLASDKIAIIDLASGRIDEEPLSDDLVASHIGGAAINQALYEQHADGDPIIIGAGLFTGTLVPGSAAATVTAKSPLTGAMVHAPLTLYAGMEFKYSGFDYLVLKNASAAPVYLWLHDGIADLSDAADIWQADVWSATKSVRAAMGDELIQTLVAGPAAVRGSALGQLMINFWASGDRFGLGRALAMKNVKLIAIRGMGLLEINDPEGFVAACLDLTAQVKAGPWGGKKGLGELGAGLGQPGLADWIAPVAHRHRAGFNTPMAYNTFAMLEGDPKGLKEPAEEAPGVLLSDPLAAIELMKLGLNA
jgi:aldehyde:ferredoxin oxidoreductase